jgi:hypothetical protein
VVVVPVSEGAVFETVPGEPVGVTVTEKLVEYCAEADTDTESVNDRAAGVTVSDKLPRVSERVNDATSVEDAVSDNDGVPFVNDDVNVTDVLTVFDGNVSEPVGESNRVRVWFAEELCVKSFVSLMLEVTRDSVLPRVTDLVIRCDAERLWDCVSVLAGAVMLDERVTVIDDESLNDRAAGVNVTVAEPDNVLESVADKCCVTVCVAVIDVENVFEIDRE